MRAPDELRALVEQGLADLTPTASLDGLSEAMRYALDGGGKRIRPVLCLATADAAGGRAEDALPAAVGLELVHTFSLVHDDLPSLDDDDERRGRPSAHVAHGEGVALLAGDALLTEGLRLALSYDRPQQARDLAHEGVGLHRQVALVARSLGGAAQERAQFGRRAGGDLPGVRYRRVLLVVRERIQPVDPRGGRRG